MGYSFSRLICSTALLVAAGWCPTGHAQTPSAGSADFEKYARILREKALLKLEPLAVSPMTDRPLNRPRYPWKTNIVTTLIVIGDGKDLRSSCWDANWLANYGGFDDPKRRQGFFPAGFTPRLNPFYVALPYNDVGRGTTKPEAKIAIPWFKDEFEQEGKSVCRDRWVHIRNREGKDCYGQWSDCGPHGSDHWQYVFGDERPKPNLNQGAGLSISPAVRDYLDLAGTDVTDWQFVDFKDVPRGPWSLYGENNGFVQNARRSPGKRLTLTPSQDQVPEPAVSVDETR